MIIERPISFYDSNLVLSDQQLFKLFPWVNSLDVDLDEFKLYLLNNNLSMWYSLSESFRLMNDYSKLKNIKYDFVIRSRFDVFARRIPANFEFENDNQNYVIIQDMKLPKGMINDWFALGDFEGMKNYCSVFDNFADTYGEVLKKYQYWCNEFGLLQVLERHDTAHYFQDFQLEWSKVALTRPHSYLSFFARK